MKWNRLESLENLLTTNPEGLRYTQGLEIIPLQSPILDDGYGSREDLYLVDNGEDEEARSDDEDDAFRTYTPSRGSSCAVNALIRLLILKLPRQQLREFSYVNLSSCLSGCCSQWLMF